MQSNNSPITKGSDPQKRSVSFDLFYYEQVGTRQYLRFTRLTLIIIFGLTFISIGMILVFFSLSGNPNGTSNVNVNITVPTPSPSPTQPAIIQQPPKPLPIKSNKQLNTNAPAPSPPSLQMRDEFPSSTPANSTTQVKSSGNSNER